MFETKPVGELKGTTTKKVMMKDKAWLVKRHLEGEGKTVEQMINIARERKQELTAHASKKKNTPVESLKMKIMEPGATNTREHKQEQRARWE